MKNISIGKLRGLQRISSARGTFTVLALDHRQNLRKANPAFLKDEELSRFKLDVTSSLAAEASAVLLDPEVSAAQAIAGHAIPKEVGLIVALESTGYTGGATARKVQIIPGWSVEKAKRMGASAVKLLVYYHPASPAAQEIEDFTSSIADECNKHDLILMVEPLSYSLDENKKLSSEEKRYVVVETAKRLTRLGVDILKAEFPLDASTTLTVRAASTGGTPVRDGSTGVTESDRAIWAEACSEVSAVSVAPWILLSAAVDYEVFLQQVLVACHAGASGIAVGRAVWKEAVTMKGEERSKFLRATARERLARLTSLCQALARPYTDFYTADAPFDWYVRY